jgi:hypothetical protein
MSPADAGVSTDATTPSQPAGHLTPPPGGDESPVRDAAASEGTPTEPWPPRPATAARASPSRGLDPRPFDDPCNYLG